MDTIPKYLYIKCAKNIGARALKDTLQNIDTAMSFLNKYLSVPKLMKINAILSRLANFEHWTTNPKGEQKTNIPINIVIVAEGAERH